MEAQQRIRMDRKVMQRVCRTGEQCIEDCGQTQKSVFKYGCPVVGWVEIIHSYISGRWLLVRWMVMWYIRLAN